MYPDTAHAVIREFTKFDPALLYPGNTRVGRWIYKELKSSFLPGALPRSGLDLNIHTGRQVQLGQRIHRPGRGRIDVQQTLVRMQLELLTSLLVHVWRTQYGKDLFAGRQGNRSRYHSARTTDGFYDLFSGFIHQIVIVRL